MPKANTTPGANEGIASSDPIPTSNSSTTRCERNSMSEKIAPETRVSFIQKEPKADAIEDALASSQLQRDFKSHPGHIASSSPQSGRDSKVGKPSSVTPASHIQLESKVEFPSIASSQADFPNSESADIPSSASKIQIRRDSKPEIPSADLSVPQTTRNSNVEIPQHWELKAEIPPLTSSGPQVPRDLKSELPTTAPSAEVSRVPRDSKLGNLTTVPSAEADALQIPRHSKSSNEATTQSAQVSQVRRPSKTNLSIDASSNLQKNSKSEFRSAESDTQSRRKITVCGGGITNTPRPSVTAAIRRGSFYGDNTPRASIVDVPKTGGPQPSPSPPPSPSRSESAASVPDSDTASVSWDHLDPVDDRIIDKWRIYVMAIIKGVLERLELMVMLPGVESREDTNLDLTEFPPEGSIELANKMKILNAANLIKFSLGKPAKESKFLIEVRYSIDVMTMTLKELEESGTFYNFMKHVKGESEKQKKPLECVAHIKQLKEQIEMLKNLMEAERQAHKVAMREWAKGIVEKKKELKDLRKQNMIEYRYKADTALAVGDLSRRDYGVRLADMRAENTRLKNDIEVEKKAHEATVEFLKKQNMELREEAVALQAGIEADTHNMDHMLEKMKSQNKEKAAILAELEPRYMARQAELEAARLEAIRKEEEYFANQGQIELQIVAARRIQRIWRGYVVRKVWKKKSKKKGKKKGKGSPKRRRPGGGSKKK